MKDKILDPLSKANAAIERRGKRPGSQIWIDTAWELLGDGSENSVSIKRLAEQLDVTRNSFYYHFKDRNELLSILVDRWFYLHDVNKALKDAKSRTNDPGEMLFSMFVYVINVVDSGQSVAIRLWAHQEADLLKRVNKEEDERRKVYGALFKKMGFSAKEATHWSNVYISMVAAEFIRFGHLSKDQRIANARKLHDTLIEELNDRLSKVVV